METFKAIASHSTPVDTEGAWDGAKAESNATNTETNLRKLYAWNDPDGDPATQAAYKFPHHNVNDDGSVGSANAKGCSAAIGALNGGRGGRPDIPAEDRQGVYNHLKKHLTDADLEAPELKASMTLGEMAAARRDAALMAEEPVFGEPETASDTNTFEMPVMVLEGATTGDGRRIESGVLTWRDLPLPVMAITKTTMGHEDAELVGKLTIIERGDANADGLIDSRTGEQHPDGTTYLRADGEFDTADWAQEIKRLVSDGFLRGVSVDIGDVQSELVLVDADGNESETDFWDWLFGDGDEEGELVEKITAGRVMGVTICPFPAFEGAYIQIPDGAGVLVSAANTSDERGPSMRIMDKPFDRSDVVLVAGAGPIAPPAEWFYNPELDGPTPMTITDDGHLFGHIATWRECHTGFNDRCVRAPHSHTDYAYYTTGAVLCDDDTIVPTGVITLGTGHAELWQNPDDAKAHYDNTGVAVADVAVGDDRHGVWFSGALRPNVDAATIRAFRGSALSGDWRQIGGHLELVATLAVNVPGFPVVRPRARVASGQEQSLVAAGIVTAQVIRKTKPTVEVESAHSVGLPDKYEGMVRQALRDRVHQHSK